MAPVLSNILVVSLEQAVAAPYCTARLADSGARVIKVERKEGDFARGYDRAANGESSYFVWLNRGKQSIAMDLKSEADRKLLIRMIADADVFVQNLAPGATDRLKLGSETLQRLNPKLVQVNISGYGPDGPYSQRKAYDLLVQADSGLASITGTSEGEARVGVSVCDIATGMHAVTAILEALLERRDTGQGAIIDIAMFDTLAEWMTVPLIQAEASGENPPRLGLHHASISPYGAFTCGDGDRVLLVVQNDREWLRFCAVLLGDEGLASDPRFDRMDRRVKNRSALNAIIEVALRSRSGDEVIALCQNAGIAFARVTDPLNLADHPHLRRVPVESGNGPVQVVAPPVVRRGATPPSFGPVPALDRHGDMLRREFAAPPCPAATAG